ncbi:MAG: hypothetical protein GC190_02575 [Alphaproteobacteria bacterium]|nr:hypothetical protein [Alphaproteobacteria bacterium]
MFEHATVAARLAAPAERVWPFLRWESLETMLPGGFFKRVDYDERRPVAGATRTITLGDGRTIRERLETISAADLAYSYRLIDTADFPLAEYVGHVRVTPAGAKACSIRFACEFTPLGITAAQWREIYGGMQEANISFIRAQVENVKPNAEPRR